MFTTRTIRSTAICAISIFNTGSPGQNRDKWRDNNEINQLQSFTAIDIKYFYTIILIRNDKIFKNNIEMIKYLKIVFSNLTLVLKELQISFHNIF